MKNTITSKIISNLVYLILSCSLCFNAFAAQRPLEVSDIMKFNSIVKPQISDNGQWIAYNAKPDRGDNTYYVKSVSAETQYSIPNGSQGTFSADGRYIAIATSVDFLTKEKSSKEEKKKLKTGLTVINLVTGDTFTFADVSEFALSDQHGYLAFSTKIETDKEDADKKESSSASEAKRSESASEESKSEEAAVIAEGSEKTATTESDEKTIKLFNGKRINYMLTLVNLSNQEKTLIEGVDSFKFSPKKPFLSYSTSFKAGLNNALFNVNFKENKTSVIVQQNSAAFNHLSWNDEGDYLAFLQGDFSEEKESRQHQLHVWKSKKNRLATAKNEQKDWFISNTNKLTWTLDGERLFFGFKLIKPDDENIDTKPETIDDLYDTDKLTADRGLQIWHGNDPLIKTNEKYQIKQDKKHFYTAVYHVDDNDLVRLAGKVLPKVKATNNENAVLATSDLKYRRIRTWEGFFNDHYVIDLESGKKTLIAEKLPSGSAVKLSESGRYVAFYENQNIWLFDAKKKKKTNLTKNAPVSFSDEDHDYPSKAPGYGIAGWLENDKGILVYDKFDIWLLSLNGKKNQCLTCSVGRPNDVQFRINNVDKDQEFITKKAKLLLTSYNDEFKNFGFYQLDLANNAVTKLREENKKFKFIAKAKEADALLFSREDFNEFPDLWVSDLNPINGKKLTNVNPQKDDFLWGKPELVDWRSAMGERHQGILIKPANYIEGVKYPVVVYYYRLFSQRMYEFNAMKVNHRPNFPFYTSNGYAIFLPDVHFEVGTPGHSTNKSIVPGIQKIVDMGVADENAIGLHGHSWSGYQTLHSITETDIFAAAVSGAPVSNMTSAYSGIRLGTGLARQFQYEQGQSRIGASLFERRDLYIENSPVFFADRINTPLLMQFGDVDDAVPWQQGVEMYLAMRRLDKEVILLQYEGEPHHLKKYPNKVDYTIKMKQYFDHYLKGAPAPSWMTDGEAYREKKK